MKKQTPTLAEVKTISSGFNSLVRVKMENGEWKNIESLTKDELSHPVIKVLGTVYPNYPNVLEVTADWKAYRG